MVPNAQQQAPNNYDYLFAKPAPQKPFMGGRSSKNKTLLSVVFVVVMLLLVVIGFSVFGALTKKDYSTYKKLIDQQTEIIRIIDSGLTKARGTTAKNYTSTLRTTTQTEKNDTIAFLKTVGSKIDDKKLAGVKNAANDKVIADAQATSDFDERYVALVNKLIIEYQKTITSSVNAATTKAEKALVLVLQSNANIVANVKAN